MNILENRGAYLHLLISTKLGVLPFADLLPAAPPQEY